MLIYVYIYNFYTSLTRLLSIVLRTAAVNLHNILGHIDKLINQPLAIDFRQNAALIVIPQRSAHRFVVHVRLVLVHAPQTGHRLRVDQLENALIPARPLDVARTVFAILQQFEQKLPQICGRTFAAASLDAQLDFRFARLLQFARLKAKLQHVGEIIADARRGRRLDNALRMEHGGGSGGGGSSIADRMLV